VHDAHLQRQGHLWVARQLPRAQQVPLPRRVGWQAVRRALRARCLPGTSQEQNSCTNSIDKGLLRSYVPLNKDCVEPIKGVKGFDGRFE
jgi:hypothetical protein